MSGHMREFAVHPDEQPDHHHPRRRRLQREDQMQLARRRLTVLRIETDKVERRVADRDRGGDAELRHQVQQREEKGRAIPPAPFAVARDQVGEHRSEEHTSELQSLMRISYAVFCLKKKKTNPKTSDCTSR